MLSGETSVGLYPLETVKIMKKIVKTAEKNLSAERLISLRRREKLKSHESSICNAACIMGRAGWCKIYNCHYPFGRTALLLSQYRTSVPILAFTENEKTIRYLNIVWGVRGEKITDVKDTDRYH